MTRHAAHFVYCHPDRIIPKGIVEIDAQGKIAQFLSLNDYPEEIHSTVFHNGIIVPPLFEGVDFSVLQHKFVFETFDFLFQKNSIELKENSFTAIYLIEGIDFAEKRFAENCTVRKLL